MKHLKNTYKRFLDYLKDQLSEKERNAYERENLSDPFEIEASEGLDTMDAKQQVQDTENLFKKINQKSKKPKNKNYYGYRIAASVLVIFGISTLIYTTINTEKKQENFFTIPENLIDFERELDKNIDSDIDRELEKDLDENIEKNRDKDKDENVEKVIEKSSNKILNSRSNKKENPKVLNIKITKKDILDEAAEIDDTTEDVQEIIIETVKNNQHNNPLNKNKGSSTIQRSKRIHPNIIEEPQKKPSNIERNALEELSKEQEGMEDVYNVPPSIINNKAAAHKGKDRRTISPLGSFHNFKTWLLIQADSVTKDWLLKTHNSVIISISNKGYITDIQYFNKVNIKTKIKLDSIFYKAGIWKPAIKKGTFVQDTIHIKYTK